MKVLLIFCFSFVAIAKAQYENEECGIPQSRAVGVCTKVTSCPEVQERIRRRQTFKSCSFSGNVQIVCCPLTPTKPIVSTNVRVSAQKCQEYSSHVKRITSVAGLIARPQIHQVSADTCQHSTGLIIGGTKTKKGEFPHMVGIGYNKDGDLIFFCGGSLINDKFVLTAAHCDIWSISSRFGDGNFLARLGDQNIKSKLDGAKEVDVSIEDFIVHEQYSKITKQNDIALVKLSQPVTFSKTIRPACLQQTKEIGELKAIATGWGHTGDLYQSESDELLKVQLDIMDVSSCRKAFEVYNSNLVINEKQICAGVLTGGRDTCQGDSGGPLQIVLPDNKCMYSIVGVTSYGAKECGQANIPAIYTRVSDYLDWIEQRAFV